MMSQNSAHFVSLSVSSKFSPFTVFFPRTCTGAELTYFDLKSRTLLKSVKKNVRENCGSEVFALNSKITILACN